MKVGIVDGDLNSAAATGQRSSILCTPVPTTDHSLGRGGIVRGKWQSIAERQGSQRRIPAEVMYLFEQENHLRMLQGGLSLVPERVAIT